MSMISVSCPKCGKSVQIDNSNEVAFCMYCGAKIQVEEVKPEPDFSEAYVADVRSKAEAGDVTAQYTLGTMYRAGKGVEQSYQEAMKWYMKAADQGDPYAMYNIGMLYSCGYGVKQNCAIATQWYAKANEHGITRNAKKQ